MEIAGELVVGGQGDHAYDQHFLQLAKKGFWGACYVGNVMACDGM